MNLSLALIFSLTMLLASSVAAQESTQGSMLPYVVKTVFLDPTTYVPAIVRYEATRLDWQSSQIFFQNGWSEHNSRYTTSGLADDAPIGYAAGNNRILRDALTSLQFSIVHNVSERVLERVLKQRYPNHPKILTAVGWIERSVVASIWSYRLSANHLRQWRTNERLAVQFN
ncbi:MAG: hypothetical protein ND807_13555 [Vicinamibacterales bacterium]|nr:hypothetical protein [Vicinamibacterales bacterium]